MNKKACVQKEVSVENFVNIDETFCNEFNALEIINCERDHECVNISVEKEHEENQTVSVEKELVSENVNLEKKLEYEMVSNFERIERKKIETVPIVIPQFQLADNETDNSILLIPTPNVNNSYEKIDPPSDEKEIFQNLNSPSKGWLKLLFLFLFLIELLV